MGQVALRGDQAARDAGRIGPGHGRAPAVIPGGAPPWASTSAMRLVVALAAAMLIGISGGLASAPVSGLAQPASELTVTTVICLVIDGTSCFRG